MRLTINIEKRYAYIIIGSLFLIAGLVGLNAFNWDSATPSTFGHTPNEIAGYGLFGGSITVGITEGEEGQVRFKNRDNDGQADLVIMHGEDRLKIYNGTTDVLFSFKNNKEFCFGDDDCRSSWDIELETEVTCREVIGGIFVGDVNCSTGWQLTGCSGGRYQQTGNGIVLPNPTNNGCLLKGANEDGIKVCAHCARLVSP